MEFMSALGSQEDAYRPSLFELDAQQKLRELLQPAVQYAVAVSHALPFVHCPHTHTIWTNFDRFMHNAIHVSLFVLWTIMKSFMQFWCCLLNGIIWKSGVKYDNIRWSIIIIIHVKINWHGFIGGSFAENFYGLKRVSTSYLKSHAAKFASSVNGGQSSTPPLSRSQINKSLLMLVGLPYIKCRLDLLYSQVSGGSSASLFGSNEQEEREREELMDPDTSARRKLMIRLIQLFRFVYPYVNGAYHGANLAYAIAYMFNKTRYYSPWLHLIGLEIKRMSMADYVSWGIERMDDDDDWSINHIHTEILLWQDGSKWIQEYSHIPSECHVIRIQQGDWIPQGAASNVDLFLQVFGMVVFFRIRTWWQYGRFGCCCWWWRGWKHDSTTRKDQAWFKSYSRSIQTQHMSFVLVMPYQQSNGSPLWLCLLLYLRLQIRRRLWTMPCYLDKGGKRHWRSYQGVCTRKHLMYRFPPSFLS